MASTAWLQAVLSPPFQATFRHLSGGAKRAKEAGRLLIPETFAGDLFPAIVAFFGQAFLLQTALCLKSGSQKNYWDQPGANERSCGTALQVQSLKSSWSKILGVNSLLHPSAQN